MKHGDESWAFTIIEVLIFLSVSAGLLIGVFSLIGTSQQKTEFSQSVREIQSQIDEIINNVDSGYYNSPTGFRCENVSGDPVFRSVGGSGQGTSKDCIFLGMAMRFKLSSSDYKSYSIAGVKQNSSNKEVTSILEASPRAIDPVNPDTSVNHTQDHTLQYGLQVKTMRYLNPAPLDVGAVAFISTFGSYNGSDLNSGSKSVDLYPVVGTNLSSSDITVVNSISLLAGATVKNPSGGVVICFQDDAVNQFGEITIGGRNRNLTTSLNIGDGPCV